MNRVNKKLVNVGPPVYIKVHAQRVRGNTQKGAKRAHTVRRTPSQPRGRKIAQAQLPRCEVCAGILSPHTPCSRHDGSGTASLPRRMEDVVRGKLCCSPSQVPLNKAFSALMILSL
jgi:hypothetical protein